MPSALRMATSSLTGNTIAGHELTWETIATPTLVPLALSCASVARRESTMTSAAGS